MANLPKILQTRPRSPRGPNMGQGASASAWGAGSTLGQETSGVTDPTQDNQWTIKSPFGGGPRFNAVQPVNLTPNMPTDSLQAKQQQAVEAHYNSMVPVPGMGPFAQLPAGSIGPGGGGMTTLQGLDAASSIINQVQKGTGTWGGGDWRGPLGSAPSHHGYAGMQPYAQQWVLRTLGQFPNLRFSSGFRDPAYNAKIGGVKNSGHTRGVKADFSGSMAEMKLAAAWLRQYGAQTYIHPNASGNGGYHLDVSFAPIGRA